MNLPNPADADSQESQTQSAESSTAQQSQTTDDKGATSSTATKGTKGPQSLDDVATDFLGDLPTEAELAAEAAADGAAGSETTEEKAGQEGDAAGADEADANAENEQKDEKVDESLTDATKPPPFNEHPRWKEVLAERDSLKPLAEQHTALREYMQANQITGDDLRGMLEIGALIQSNPAEAFKRLKPIYDGLGQLAGETLPDDLQAEVAAGKITPAAAQKLAKAQANEAMLRQQRSADVQRSQQAGQQQMVAALSEWVSTKQRTDLGFKPGSPLYQLVDDRFMAMSQRTPARNAQEAVRMVEAAYQEVKKLLPTAPRAAAPAAVKNGTKTFSSNGSTVTQKTKEPTTIEEAAMQATGTRWKVPKKGF